MFSLSSDFINLSLTNNGPRFSLLCRMFHKLNFLTTEIKPLLITFETLRGQSNNNDNSNNNNNNNDNDNDNDNNTD